jgi:hypothetical protein
VRRRCADDGHRRERRAAPSMRRLGSRIRSHRLRVQLPSSNAVEAAPSRHARAPARGGDAGHGRCRRAVGRQWIRGLAAEPAQARTSTLILQGTYRC